MAAVRRANKEFKNVSSGETGEYCQVAFGGDNQDNALAWNVIMAGPVAPAPCFSTAPHRPANRKAHVTRALNSNSRSRSRRTTHSSHQRCRLSRWAGVTVARRSLSRSRSRSTIQTSMRRASSVSTSLKPSTGHSRRVVGVATSAHLRCCAARLARCRKSSLQSVAFSKCHPLVYIL